MFGARRRRYTEAVGPLIVHAQRKLVERITQQDGQASPQPHLGNAVADNGGQPLSPADYAQLQLRVVFDGVAPVQETEHAAVADPPPRINSYSCTLAHARLPSYEAILR